jgi:YaiO family outer membrane protein
MAVGCLVVLLIAASPCSAQSSRSIVFGVERSLVTIGDAVTHWDTARLQASLVRPKAGGWYAVIERQRRGQLSDVVVKTSAYRRLGDWTIAGGAGGSVHPSFLYRASAEAEVSRRIAGTLVGSMGYRYLGFAAATVQQWQPALTWYHTRGEISGRMYLTHKGAGVPSSVTGTLSTLFDVSPRVRLGASVAYGDRIFDVAALPTAHAAASMANARVRFGLTSHDFVEVGAGAAQEHPSFTQRTLSLVYRRVF